LDNNDKAMSYFARILNYFEKTRQTPFYNSKKALQYTGLILNEKGDNKSALLKFKQLMNSFDREMNNWENLNNIAKSL
jgi:hypothetical protein